MLIFGKAPDGYVIVFCLRLFAAAEVVLVLMWCPCSLHSPPVPERTPASPLLLWSCCLAMDAKDFVEQVRKFSCCVTNSFAECVKIA
jgi:hypothetical protein